MHLLLRRLLDLRLRRLLDLWLHPPLRLLLLLFSGLVSLLLRCVARLVLSGPLFLLRGIICLRRDGRGRLFLGTVVAATAGREQDAASDSRPRNAVIRMRTGASVQADNFTQCAT